MLTETRINGGDIETTASGWRLHLPPTSARMYADAQLQNYQGLRRSHFPNRPPTRLSVRARASHLAPAGTLGFGFWNDPFSLKGGVLAAPNCVWFFYASPPSDMALVEGVPGYGWKAATLNAGRWPTLLLAPAALVAIGLTRLPKLGRWVMALARRAVQAHEAPLADDIALTEWHTYSCVWESHAAIFEVDGHERLRAPTPPRGPLGFVAWIDNQYAIASRAGRFGFGLCESPQAQWLELEQLKLE